MIRTKRIMSLALTCTMCLGLGIQADASELNETREKASQLQNQKKAAEDEKASLAAQLESIAADMEEIQENIEAKEEELTAKEEELVFLCGHYEGIDERVLEEIVTDYVSIGDYVLTGGELPAMIMVDAISRLVPGVLHNDVSTEFESFQDHLLEYPQYSRPEVWHDKRVPEVLMSGHHANIEKWRREQSVIRTAKNLPDLLLKAELTEEEKRLAEEISGCKAGDMGL